HGKSIIAVDEVLCFFWLSSGPLILLETCGIANLALQGSSGSGWKSFAVEKNGRKRVLTLGGK
nr:hypothetical protein [Tanacetum cinerariifolium]